MTESGDDLLPAPSSNSRRSILILRLSALGDVIHTIPAVVALQHALPDSEIGWVVEGAYRDLVRSVARTETIPVAMKKWGRAFVAHRGEMFAARAAMRGYDVAVDFQGLIKSASLAWVSRARERFGFDRDAIRETPAGVFLNRRVSVDPALHIVEQNVALARAVAPAIDGVPRVDFTAFGEDPTGKLSALENRVVLLPGTGRADKQWPADRFREVARSFGAGNVVAVWGPGEESLAAAIGCELAPATSLRELAWLLKRARLVIAGDTGPLHLAAALGTPVVALFGPTDPRRNGPFGQLANVVETWSSTKSMLSIDVDAVMRKAGEALSDSD
jgi:lipopolysaccharide heptosyltransferase I